MPTKEDTSLFKSLLKILREQIEALEHRLTNEQISNLAYAFRRILPKSPDELAFVLAVGLHQKSIFEVVSEYLRRKRKNDTVFYPYNKILHAQKILATSWGVLIYREQADEILEELTGKRYGDLPATIFLDVDVLTECLKPDYKRRLREKEIEKISKDLRQYTKIGFNSYAWCLETAERVLKAVKDAKD